MNFPQRPAPLPGRVVLAVATATATLVLHAVHLPSPALFGGLVGGMACALTMHAPVRIPPRAFTLGQGLVGVTIGAMVSMPTLRRVGTDWPSILAVTTGTLAISVLAGQLLRLRSTVSATTGAFAMVAGGASGVAALAHDLGADDRVVTIVQYLRVLLVLLAMPVVTALVFHPPQGPGAVPEDGSTSLPAGALYTAVSLGLGLLVARSPRLPAGSLLGPLVVAVLVTVSGALGTVAVPPVLAGLGYLLVGVQVGLRFTSESLRSIAALLPLATALIALVIVACAGMGALLSATTGVDGLTTYLATTPGGLYAVLATAADSGSDVTYVLAVQVIRVFAMLLAAPLLARALVGPAPAALPGLDASGLDTPGLDTDKGVD